MLAHGENSGVPDEALREILPMRNGTSAGLKLTRCERILEEATNIVYRRLEGKLVA